MERGRLLCCTCCRTWGAPLDFTARAGAGAGATGADAGAGAGLVVWVWEAARKERITEGKAATAAARTTGEGLLQEDTRKAVAAIRAVVGQWGGDGGAVVEEEEDTALASEARD